MCFCIKTQKEKPSTQSMLTVNLCGNYYAWNLYYYTISIEFKKEGVTEPLFDVNNINISEIITGSSLFNHYCNAITVELFCIKNPSEGTYYWADKLFTR